MSDVRTAPLTSTLHVRIPADRRLLAAAVVVFAASVVGYAFMVHAAPGPLWTLSDAFVYRDAGTALRNGTGTLYTAKFGDPPLDYLYTPFAALCFAAMSLLSAAVWKYGLTILGIAIVFYVVYAALGIAGARIAGARVTGSRRLALAFTIAAAALWLEPVQRTLSFGQINLLLLALIVGDFVNPDRRRWAGVGVGLAAAVKLTPLIFVPYLLFGGRRRAGLVSAATFAATLVIGFIADPSDSSAYWLHGKIFRSDVIKNVLVNQSLLGFAERLLHDGSQSGHLYAAFSLVFGALGLGAAITAARRGDALLGLVVCGVTGLLVSPVSWTHHWVFTVPALVLIVPRPHAVWLRSTASRIAFGIVTVGLFTAWPERQAAIGGWSNSAPWSDSGLLRLQAHGGTPELHWNAVEMVLGDYYVLVGMLLILCVAAALWIPRRSADSPSDPPADSPSDSSADSPAVHA